MEELGHTIQLTERIETNNPHDEIYDTYGIYFEGIAPEIYVGYSRLRRFGNTQTIRPEEKISNPQARVNSLMENNIYACGNWTRRHEYVQSFNAEEKKGSQSSISIKYNGARCVHVIMGTLDRE